MEIENIDQNVDRVTLGGKQIYLVGTAHVSELSAELAEKIIEEVKPESVAVELCESRHASLQNPDRWKNTDIVSVIREGKVYLLMAQLILAGFQKKMGKHLNVKPGAEMMRALEAASAVGALPVLADRDVRVTLKRTWSALSFWGALKVLGAMIASLFHNAEIDAAELERLKSSDALEELLRDFSKTLPDVRRTLIDERDQYLAAKIAKAPGNSIVAVIGAAHVPGIKRWIREEIDLTPLEVIPEPSLAKKIGNWIIPGLVVALIIVGFFSSPVKGAQMLSTWAITTGVWAGLGAALALAHPLAILAAIISAPITSVHPLLASGWVSGLVQALVRKPKVSDLEDLGEAVISIRGIFRNRVTHILLVICLTNLFGTIGTLLGIERIWSIMR